MSTEPQGMLRLEVVPSRDLAAQLPPIYQAPGAVSITCLPHHGPSKTVEAAVELAAMGYHAVPHLAARSVTSRAELHGFLEQLGQAGVTELFLIAGDRRGPAGPYSWSGPLIDDVKAFSPEFSVGVAGYPEGHPGLTPQQLRNGLERKSPQAASLVTQMCFSADAISRYFDSLRQQGFELPVWVGVPGPITVKKLVSMGARLGVGRSLKLARGTGLARALWRRSDFAHFDSNRLIRDIHGRLGGHPLFAGFHLYTFNDLQRLPALLDGLPKPVKPTHPGPGEARPLYLAQT
ncbi:methylenetetrahydrofolate reductase [Arthrobacter sp. M4]|uniref:methylenetetrahydrofolate reductase n=1 Tax=Arthrobacter sp. M4 TaxID=218160 RepID=UPI001CDB8697|nr:methylenetetrahydrofolate reductase [Arthrobacter sp. M4]MCA4134546.1 methylenetetrahydrofolate reductase [Arthrobacter sp. M4]